MQKIDSPAVTYESLSLIGHSATSCTSKEEITIETAEQPKQVEFLSMISFPPMASVNPKYANVYVRDCYMDIFEQLSKQLETNDMFNVTV